MDAKSYMDIYGAKGAWSYLSNSYRGLLPFDGTSIVKALNRAGVGLCLHKDEHRETATPSLRIFEITASGAVAICQEHPFIREAFGDAVLYLDWSLDATGKVAQISEHMRWIAANPEAARQMSKKAYDIFAERYSLEVLLRNLIPYHEKLIAEKGFVAIRTKYSAAAPTEEKVQIIVRVGDRDVKSIERALDSIAHQTDDRIGAIIVKYREVGGLAEALEKYLDRFAIKVVESPYTGFRSTQLWAGLKHVSAEYFAVLDDDDLIYPNHVSSLLALIENNKRFGIAYSGAIRVWESAGARESKTAKLISQATKLIVSPTVSDGVTELAYFDPFDINRLVALDNFITSNSFLGRSALLDDLSEDPRMEMAEDLFLLLSLSLKTEFVFSYEVTSEFLWRIGEKENATFAGNPVWERSLEQIKRIFWQQDFPAAQRIGVSYDSQAVEIRRLQNHIAHMERSKFWRLRERWFKVKKAINLKD